MGLRGQSDVERCVRLVKTRSQHLRENEGAIGAQLSTSDEVQLITFYAERFRALTDQIEAEADIVPEIQAAEHQTEVRQAGALDAMQGFQADMDIIQQNLQMLEFDTPPMSEPLPGGPESRDFGESGKAQQLSAALGTASAGRGFADDGGPLSHPSHQASVSIPGRRGMVPPPTYPSKPSRSAFGQHPTVSSHGGPLTSIGQHPPYHAQHSNPGAPSHIGYSRRATSSKGADGTSNERPQPFS